MDHLVTLDDLSAAEILAILDRADGQPADLSGSVVCTAFFEPSTRTRLSFETAAHRQGADVIGFSEAGSTSSAKGETLEDTTRVLAGYADVLVIRHPDEGAAKRAAAVSDIPVVNAGDGAGEHPTQTLIDLYTIRHATGGIAGRKVAVIGDLRYGRTVHSLVPALQKMGAEVMQVPAPGLDLPRGSANGIPIVSLDEAAATADVLYVTRVQKERFDDGAAYQAAKGALIVDAALLAGAKSKAIVLHPLPRVDEIATDVDALPAAKYFDQAKNGVPVRMAVLAMLLENRP